MNLNNLALRFYDDPEETVLVRESARTIPLERWTKPHRRFKQPRVAAVAVTAIVHAVFISALLFGTHVRNAPAVRSLSFVALSPERDTDLPPPPLKIVPPEQKVLLPAPEVMIALAPPAPSAITAEIAPPQPVSPEAQNAYFVQLFSHLNRHKRVVRAPGGQAKVMLSFTVDKDGNVLEFALAKASGIRTVDEEAVALLRRAQPLPAFPPTLHRDLLKLVLPIDLASR